MRLRARSEKPGGDKSAAIDLAMVRDGRAVTMTDLTISPGVQGDDGKCACARWRLEDPKWPR